MPSMFPDSFAFRIVFPISHYSTADPTADRSRVAADSAIGNLALLRVLPMPPPCTFSRVAADSTVYDSQTAPIINRDSATSTGRRVAADCAVDDCDTTRGF